MTPKEEARQDPTGCPFGQAKDGFGLLRDGVLANLTQIQANRGDFEAKTKDQRAAQGGRQAEPKSGA